MSVLGIGVDIVNVQRIADLIHRRGSLRFASKILSANELTDWRNVGNSRNEARFLAVRFSVKEAAYKALFPTIIPTWKDLTYKSYDRLHYRSKPMLSYHPLDTNKRGLVGPIHVSVSHDGGFVVASVVVESSNRLLE